MQSKTLERMVFSKRLIISNFTWQYYQIIRPLFVARSLHKRNHYEVLGLSHDCSQADIRNAFLRLSKELHPDRHPDATEKHKEFIAVQEAYSVLIRKSSRHFYDAELTNQSRMKMYNYDGVATNAPRERVIFKDDSFWENRDRSEDKNFQDRPYYGVPGINKKLPNLYIAGGCVFFMIIGALFHYVVAKKSSDFAIQQLNDRDRMASANLMHARQQALSNGNQLQMALFKKRVEDERLKNLPHD